MQTPVRELDQYHTQEIVHQNIRLEEKDGTVTPEGVKGRVFDMTVELEDHGFGRFEIALAADEKNRTSLIYDREMKR